MKGKIQMMRRIFHTIFLTVLSTSFSSVYAANSDCLENEGYAICTKPEPTQWSYGLCDNKPTWKTRRKTWCEVVGGTWNYGGYERPTTCDGDLTPLSEGNLYAIAEEFERRIHGACTITGQDNGWLAPGEEIPQSVYGWNCWYGGPVYENGIETHNLREMIFNGTNNDCEGNWDEAVLARRDRSLQCPSGYAARYVSGGNLICVKYRSECHETGNPIQLLLGTKVQRETDYLSGKQDGLVYRRFYNSAGYYRPITTNENPDVKSSDYWVSNYDRHIFQPSDTEYVLAIARRADGALKFFSPSGKMLNRASVDHDVIEILPNNSGYRYTASDDSVEIYNNKGYLLSISAKSGITQSLIYDSNDRLIGVETNTGETLQFGYDANGNRVSMTDTDGQLWKYQYSSSNLVKAIFPDDTPGDDSDNPNREYHYENSSFPHALTGITDENGVRYATWTYDDEGRAISSEHAGGVDNTAIDYTYLGDSNDPRVTVTNPLGKQTTYHFTTIQGVRKVTQVEGHPTASCEGANKLYSYDPNGNVISKTDWNGVTTTYTYDMDRNLELSRTEAMGTPQERTITTEWHQDYRLPIKITEPGRVTEYTYDAQGRQLSSKVSSIQ